VTAIGQIDSRGRSKRSKLDLFTLDPLMLRDVYQAAIDYLPKFMLTTQVVNGPFYRDGFKINVHLRGSLVESLDKLFLVLDDCQVKLTYFLPLSPLCVVTDQAIDLLLCGEMPVEVAPEAMVYRLKDELPKGSTIRLRN
jgi:hypothetical protein